MPGGKEWRASSNGPDWTDISQVMWDFDQEENTSTAVFIEPVMSRGGGSIFCCISVRTRVAKIEKQPSLAVVQGYWPEPEGRTLPVFLYRLLLRAQDTAADKLLREAPTSGS